MVEPSTTGSINEVLLLNDPFNTIIITSDVPFVSTGLPTNGTPITDTEALLIQIAPNVTLLDDLQVTFNDNSNVPEPATLWFLLVALVPVMAFRRKLRTLLRFGC